MARMNCVRIGTVALDIIRELDAPDAVALLNAVIAWQMDGVESAPEGVNRGVWAAVRAELVRMDATSAAHAEAGKSGGRPKKNQTKPDETKQNQMEPAESHETEQKPAKASESKKESKSKNKSKSENEKERYTSARRGDSRPPAPAQAPARTREERPGGTPPEPPAPRREISSHDSQSPEEPPGTPQERAQVAEAIERALGIEDRTGRPVAEEWEWQVRDPVEATIATYGKGAWGKYRSALGPDRFRDIVETYWRECRAGEHADAENHAAIITTRLKEALR